MSGKQKKNPMNLKEDSDEKKRENNQKGKNNITMMIF